MSSTTDNTTASSDLMTSTVDGEITTSNDATAKTGGVNQLSPTGDAANDHKPQDTLDEQEDSTSIVKAEKPDSTTEQLDRYKRCFKMW